MADAAVHRELRDFAAFVEDQGHLGETTLSVEASFDCRRRLDEAGRATRIVGHDVGISAIDRRAAVEAFGASTFGTRDGTHFVLQARPVATLPGGYVVLAIVGVRVGLYRFQLDRVHAVRMPDGSRILGGSAEGVRRKVVDVLRTQIEEMTRPGATLRRSQKARDRTHVPV